MMNFDINLTAHIQGQDGDCGQLAGLVIDPEVRYVTNLIVKRGYLMAKQRVVPIAMVQNAVEDDVYLSISSNELDQYPEYRLVEYEEPAVEPGKVIEVAAPYGLHGAAEPTVPTRKRIIREGIASNQKVIEPGMLVKNLKGRIGKAMRMVVNQKHNEITCLVVQRGMIFHEYLVVPFALIEDVLEGEIMVSGADETVENLMKYKDLVRTDFLIK